MEGSTRKGLLYGIGGETLSDKLGKTISPGDRLKCITDGGTEVHLMYLGRFENTMMLYLYKNTKYPKFQGCFCRYSKQDPINKHFQFIEVIKQNEEQMERSKKKAKETFERWKELNTVQKSTCKIE